jgi:hypothetical protein
MKTLDKNDCQIYECKFKDIISIFENYHYKKGHMGGGISMCFAMTIKDKLSGGAVLGKPRHQNKYKNCIDIRRMACLDESLKNSESWFLGAIIKWVAIKTEYNYVLSYSDKTVGHEGIIYKASNFKCIGETAPTKYVEWNGKIYHPRSLSIDRDYSYRMREDVKKGKAVIKTGLPKKIWIYEITKKQKNKNINFNNIEVLNGQQTLKI